MPSEAYNGLGLQVGKTDSTGTYSYVCDGASPGSPVLSDGHALYTPGLSESRGGVSTYAASDVLGNLWFMDNGSGQQTYYQDTTGFGTVTAQAGSGSPFGYGGGNGCQTDADTGVVLMGHRYYDTRIGRFISQDPAGSGDNWYEYADNNPVNKTDPLGLTPMDGPGSSPVGSPGYSGDTGGAGIVNQEDDYESYVNNQQVTQNRIDHALGEIRAGTTQLGESSTTTEAGIEQLMELAKEGYQLDEFTLKGAYKGIQDWAEARGIPIRPTSDNHVGERIFERFNSLKDFRNVWSTGKGYAISTYENQYALYSSALKMAIIWDGTANQVFTVYSRQNANGWIPVGRGFLP